jgi:enterochelin esterase family protein
MSATALFRPTFTDLRAEIERRLASGGSSSEIDALLDQFLAAYGENPVPLVEYDGTVTWIYRDGRAENVSVIGDFLGYDPARTRMARVADSGLFYLTAQIPLDAQLAYAFAVDAGHSGEAAASPDSWLARCTPDPLNPRRIVATHPLRELSVLKMPGAVPIPQLDDMPEHPSDVTLNIVRSSALGELRRVWVHLPEDYSPRTRRYPTVYFLNGEAHLVSAHAAAVQDALSAAGETIPAVLVFVERPSHHDEDDAAADSYLHFLADELVPWVEERYAVSPDPRDRVVVGAAVAGALALYAALERPEVFAGVAAQSPAPILLIDAVAARLAEGAALGLTPPRCYVDVGRYDAPAVVEHAHALCNALLGGGAPLSYQDFPGDHSFVGWRSTMPDLLRFHLGAEEPLDEL